MSKISGFTCSSPSHPGIPPLEKKEAKQISMLKNFTDGRKFSKLVLRCSSGDPPSSSKDSFPTDTKGNNEPLKSYASSKLASGCKDDLKNWIKDNVCPGDRIGLVVCGERKQEKRVFTFAHPNSKTLIYFGYDIEQHQPLQEFLVNDTVSFVVDPLTRRKLGSLHLKVKHVSVSYKKKFWGVSEVGVQGLKPLSEFTAEKAHWLSTQGWEKGCGGEAEEE